MTNTNISLGVNSILLLKKTAFSPLSIGSYIANTELLTVRCKFILLVNKLRIDQARVGASHLLMRYIQNNSMYTGYIQIAQFKNSK
jgi:hypothetical protein